jgi:glycosyltransferase involved in cell wall biosynthesis
MLKRQRDRDGPPRRTRIAFITFNARFFLSHFLPAVEAARASGFEIFALLPSVPDDAAWPRDVKVIPIRAGRSHHPILRLPADVIAIWAALRKCQPDIVQAIALHSCVITTLASMFVPVDCKILTITGLGLIDIDRRWSSRIMRAFVYWLLRAADNEASTSFVFENAADPVRINFAKGRPGRKMTLMGAGVNPSVFAPRATPALPPLKVAIVSRMIWSKGVDLAVAAVGHMIDRGMPVELDIYGGPDFENQRHFPVALLQEWSRRPGIRWRGHVADVVGVWRDHHVALFPSRGGEGLPRALLEAASCGRAVIAADVPGCAEFVRPDVEGIIVKPNAVEDLERAIGRLLQQPDLIERMGGAARQRVLDNATEEIIARRYRQFFAELLRAHALPV